MSEDQCKAQDRTKMGLALVTGGTGAVGPSLVHQLISDGFAVRVVARHSPPTGTLPPGTEICIGDVGDEEFLRKAVKGAEFVFHLAGRLHIPNPGPDLEPEYWRVNVGGTRCLVAACLAEGVRRLVYFSTISVYGSTPGGCVDEDVPPHPQNIYAETKLAGEKMVLEARGLGSEAPLGVVLRMATIYGPRMKGNYRKLFNALSRGLFVPIGDGANRCTLIYEQDASRAAVLAAQHPLAAGGIFNVSDGAIYSLRDVIASICAAAGRLPPRYFLPVPPVRWIARTADGVAKLAGHSLNLTTMVDRFVQDVAVRAERIESELAFQPLYGLREGWQHTVASWKAVACRANSDGP